QIDNALAVKMIMESTDFDLGNTLCARQQQRNTPPFRPLQLDFSTLQGRRSPGLSR
ncbi:hypothetical protein A2U01_0093882, partial [Trifolium medium]|nr:hypothetical protein [Trifolium medium]